MTLDPRSSQFWNEENERLWEVIQALAIAAYLDGAAFGVEQLPAQASLLIDPDIFIERVQAFLNNYKLANVGNITATTRNKAIIAINDWVASGQPLDVLKKDLAPIFGDGRASVIATTEVTNIFSGGQIAAWTESNVVGANAWETVNDSKVTPLCRALSGKVARLGQPFIITDADLANPAYQGLDKMVAQFGRVHMSPAAHPNCRSRLRPIVDQSMFEREIDRILAEDE